MEDQQIGRQVALSLATRPRLNTGEALVIFKGISPAGSVWYGSTVAPVGEKSAGQFEVKSDGTTIVVLKVI